MDTENPVKAEKQPLVSIGIPTYNRLRTLQRTVESALKQDYRPLEIVISDNASDDGTEEFCRKTAQENPAVKYFRQPQNQGGFENFQQVLNRASSHFFMWLADDDWIEPNYVSECVKFLLAHPDYVLAGGVDRQRCVVTGNVCDVNKPNLPQESGPERVIAYHQGNFYSNGIFYGLMPKKLIQKIGLKPGLDGDRLTVAALAFTGKVKILETTMLHRATKPNRGTDIYAVDSYEVSLLRCLNMPLFFNENYFRTSVVLNASKDFFRRKSVYNSLSFFRKCRLFFQVFTIIFRKWRILEEIITKTPLFWLVIRLVIRPPYRLLKKCFYHSGKPVVEKHQQYH